MNHRELLVLAIGVFLTVVAWMLVDIFSIQNKSGVASKISKAPKADYKIDEKILKILKEKVP